MAKRRAKRKPSDPADILAAKRAKFEAEERAKLRAEGVDVNVVDLDGIEISHARQAELEAKGAVLVLDQRRRLQSAVAQGHHKADIWWRLHKREALSRDQLNAVRDLQDLMAMRAGLGGRNEARSIGDVRPDEPFRDPCLVTDAMLRAGVEMDLTLSMVGPPLSRLLTALLWPGVMGEHSDWRDAVASATGEKEIHAQGALLRLAAQALVDVRQEVAKRLQAAGKGRSERRDPQGLAAPTRTHPFHAGVGV